MFLCSKSVVQRLSRLHLASLSSRRFISVSNSATSNDKSSVRIGCASGFWGDSSVAATQLVTKGNIDFLVFDYLSEITMSLLTAAKRKNPDMGYTPDFVHQAISPNLPAIHKNGIRVVSNAGGINPKACAEELKKVAEKQGMKLDVAVITGDDMMNQISRIKDGIKEMRNGKSLPASVVSMSAYYGATPIKRALDLGAQIVITGRCVDSAVVLAPLMHSFHWSTTDYDRLAAGSVAGHLVECGAQSTGGIFTDWQQVEGWDDIGFPIVDCKPDGSFILTKPPGTGGTVSPATAAEQLTYEIGDPSQYLLPDVSCDFRNVTMETVTPGESVLVQGAKGFPPSNSLKVCATYVDGFRATAVCVIGGKRAIAKGRKTAESILTRVRNIYRVMGLSDFSRVHIQAIGDETMYGKNARTYGRDGEGPRECSMWIAVEHKDKKALEIFAREVAPAGTGMAPGLAAIVGGRPRVSPVLKLFSFLHPKEDLRAAVHINGEMNEEVEFEGSKTDGKSYDIEVTNNVALEKGSNTFILEDLAYTRSGDKGNDANIGVIARSPSFVPYLRRYLTAGAVHNYFENLFDDPKECPVTRYEMPGINGFNFVLEDCLGGGGVASVRPDPQGKSLGQMLLDFELHNMPNILNKDT